MNRLQGRLLACSGCSTTSSRQATVNAGATCRAKALLTLGDSSPVLRDAWPKLRAEPGTGLQRLCRLVDQRLRDARGVVRTVAVEPLIALLLDDETPWTADKHLQDLFRGWLRALVVAGTPAGYPLRLRLRRPARGRVCRG